MKSQSHASSTLQPQSQSHCSPSQQPQSQSHGSPSLLMQLSQSITSQSELMMSWDLELLMLISLQTLPSVTLNHRPWDKFSFHVLRSPNFQRTSRGSRVSEGGRQGYGEKRDTWCIALSEMLTCTSFLILTRGQPQEELHIFLRLMFLACTHSNLSFSHENFFGCVGNFSQCKLSISCLAPEYNNLCV